MLRDHLLTLYRSLARHRLYAALNLGGLAVGIAVFLVLMLTVRFETSFDRWIPNARDIYRLNVTWTLPPEPPATYGRTQGVALPLLMEDYPQITAGTRVKGDEVTVRQGEQHTREDIFYVDPGFFRVFDLPLAAGSKATALADVASLVLNETLARKYFGDQPAVGRTLNLTFGGVERPYRVTAVLEDLPDNTTLELPMMAPLHPSLFEGQDRTPVFDRWGSSTLTTYLRFSDPDAAGVVNADLRRFVDRRVTRDEVGDTPGETLAFSLIPLASAYFADAGDPTADTSAEAAVVATLAVVGVMTLLIAVINYVNLATARAALRAREVAIRKVLGGTRRALALQFLTEAVALAGLAALLGLALAELALPVVNALGGTTLKLRYFGQDGVVLPLALVAVLTGLVAGAYPALVLSRFAPAAVLASAKAPGGGRAGMRVREALVAVQFAIAVAFTICTAVMLAQADYLRRADLGFRREGLILIEDFRDPSVEPRRSALLAAFRAVPGVVSATASSRAPADENSSSSNASRPGHVGPEPSLEWEMVGPDYFKTYGVELAAGRGFDPANRLDDIAEARRKADLPGGLDLSKRNAMLNETAVTTLGFSDPASAVGQTIRFGGQPLTVVGVARDVRFRSPRDKIPGLLYLYHSGDFPDPVAAIRYRGDPQAVLNRLETEWRRLAPSTPFEAKTVEQSLADYYKPDEQRGRLFTLGAVLAIAIGCVGLYGLASFTTSRRTKEIGIRKALGASTTDVLRLLVGQFLRPVVIAGLIASPAAFLLMRAWLGRFDQRIELQPGYFIGPMALALAVALLTVVGQALRVARAEPAKALRYE